MSDCCMVFMIHCHYLKKSMVTKINDSKLKANNLPFHLFRVHVRVLAE